MDKILENVIRNRLSQHRENLRLWETSYLKPTEPDPKERARVMYDLALAIEELEAILEEAGLN